MSLPSRAAELRTFGPNEISSPRRYFSNPTHFLLFNVAAFLLARSICASFTLSFNAMTRKSAVPERHTAERVNADMFKLN